MKNEKRKFFDDLAQSWEDLHYRDSGVNQRLDELILKFRIKQGFKVLDLGCGTGIISGRLARLIGKQGRVFCCDFSLPMLEVAKKKGEAGLAFICADAQYLPFKPCIFDSVVCFSCFPHFRDKEKAIKEAWRVLKEGGFLVIAHLLCSSQIAEVHKRVNGAVSGDKIPSKKWMVASIERAGFKMLEFRDSDGLYLLHAEKIT